MNRDLVRTLLTILLGIIAGTVFLYTREVLVLFTALVFMAGMIITWRSEERDFYAFMLSIPLVVAIGEYNLPAGLIALIPALVLLMADMMKKSLATEYIGLMVIPIILAGIVLLIPARLRIQYLLLLLLVAAVAGSTLFLVRNRLLKEHYLRNTL
jgi:hypothetical protein